MNFHAPFWSFVTFGGSNTLIYTVQREECVDRASMFAAFGGDVVLAVLLGTGWIV